MLVTVDIVSDLLPGNPEAAVRSPVVCSPNFLLNGMFEEVMQGNIHVLQMDKSTKFLCTNERSPAVSCASRLVGPNAQGERSVNVMSFYPPSLSAVMILRLEIPIDMFGPLFWAVPFMTLCVEFHDTTGPSFAQPPCLVGCLLYTINIFAPLPLFVVGKSR